MSLAQSRITALLSRQLGLSPQSLGGRAIESALQRRMTSLKRVSLAEYADLVENDRRELDELIEAVVVPETWFYRYPESFRHLGEFCRGLPASRTIRLLSAPCATGEECYSILMALSEADIPLQRIQLDGVDISRRAIEAAKLGIYSENAFREPTMPPREKYFLPHNRDWIVRRELQSRVRFRVANLAESSFLAEESPYDVIFCRNLVIYLTDDARRQLLMAIHRLLLPTGVIYMGHAEPLTLMDQQYKSLSPPQAFVFGRNPQPLPASINSQARVLPSEAVSSFVTSPTKAPPGSSGLFPPLAPELPLPQPVDSSSNKLLSDVRSAMDRGEMAEAELACQQHLQRFGPSAEAYALLGSARMIAQDLASAERHFTRALYLDPTHYDSLLQMLSLAERRGDPVAAANYRRRLSKVDRKGKE